MLTRNGKHKKGNVRLGVYTTQEQKAIALLVAQVTNRTLTQVILDSINREAARVGVVVNNKVAEQLLPLYEIARSVVAQSTVNG